MKWFFNMDIFCNVIETSVLIPYIKGNRVNARLCICFRLRVPIVAPRFHKPFIRNATKWLVVIF